MDPLNERLKKIESRLAAIESKFDVQPSAPFCASSNQDLPSIHIASSLQKNASDSYIHWIKENWIVGIGIFLIISAIGWLINYAFANYWIGETARVLVGLISGVVIYLAGFWLLKKKPRGGQALIILGEVITIIAFFAGHDLYSLLSAFQTLILMLAVVNLTAFIAIKNNLEGAGVSSIIFSAIIPALLNFESPSTIFLMLYVMVLNFASLWMWTRRGWGKAFYFAWLATFAYSFSLVDIQEQWVVNLFIWAFYLIFFLSIALSIHNKKLPSLPFKGVFILLTLTFAFMFWVDHFTKFPWKVVFYFTASLLSLILGYFMAKNWNLIESKTSTLKYTLGGVIGFSAMTLIFMATYALTQNLFQDPVLSDVKTLLYFIEVSLAVLIGRFILGSTIVPVYISLFFIIPLITLFKSPQSIIYAPFLSFKFATVCAAMISLFIAARANLDNLLNPGAYSFQKMILNLLWIMTGVTAMILVWNICHQIFLTEYIGRGVALVSYIIAAEILIYVGNLKQLKNLRIAGIAMILFVIYRLLEKEVWQMPIVERMITFVVIGLLLVGTAFFDKKYKKQSISQ